MTNVDRVALVLRSTINDPTDPSSWLVDDRPPTPDEVEALAGLTLNDWQAAIGVLTLDKELTDRAAIESCRGFAEAAEGFLARFPHWGR